MQNDIRAQQVPSMRNINQPSSGVRLAHDAKKFLKWGIIILIIVAVLIIILAQLNKNVTVTDYQINKEGYQAVFINNGETYFGQVVKVNDQVLVLENVHYLQSQESLQSGAQPKESEIALIKLGNELHGPQGQMIIPVSSISYLENLKDTSAIVRAISKSAPISGVEK